MSQALVIIPTYKEKENIASILETVLDLSVKIDVLVVDDNSPDGTAQIVKNYKLSNPGRINILEREKKLGLGTAYIAGFQFALDHNYQYIFEMDADFSHNPNDLVKLLEACVDQGADVAVGSRYIKGVNVVNWPMIRVLMSFFASKYVRLVTGLPVMDATAGFKCYKRKVLETMELDKIHFIGYAFQIEMKFNAWKHGFNIVEVPIIFTDRTRGQSKMSLNIFREALLGVVELKIRSFFKKYPPAVLSIEPDNLDGIDTTDDGEWNEQRQAYN